MTGFLYLTILITQCGFGLGDYISQLGSTVRVQPGMSTSLNCHVQLGGHFVLFWMKIPLDNVPVCIATARSFENSVVKCKDFEKISRINVTWNQKTFNLLFLSVEQADFATYICGAHNYGKFFFGNGSTLIFEEHDDVVSTNSPVNNKDEKDGKNVFEYLVPVLAATNGASIFLIILLYYYHLKKIKSGVTSEVSCASDKVGNTDEVNYAALNFGHKQRRTVQKRTEMETAVIYGAVRHQEGL